jgi:ribosome biogenesis GTPase
MLELDFDRLRPIGLTPALAQGLLQHVSPERITARAARVTEVQRESVHVHDGEREYPARIAPALQRLGQHDDALAVGDWGVVHTDAHGAPWLADRVAPGTQLVRRAADGARQSLVHNVDTAFIVMGLDGDFNPRRVERYLALVHPAGIWPVIVLTKRDCVDAPQARYDTLRARIPSDVALEMVDATSAAAAATLAPYLDAGRTVVLVGSSGAGKSTLTNTLAGTPLQTTSAVRAGDSRGRHTTTARTLHVIPGRACIIDTPGLRGLRPDIDEADLGASFADIAQLAVSCRFRDCTHREEPGCAVRTGIDADRLRNFHKLQREIRRETMDALARREWLAQMKARARTGLARMRAKRGD